ncbi:hypothetical protein Thermus77927_09740 [Thermus hydrothermalis]
MNGTVRTIARMKALLEHALTALREGKTETAEKLVLEAHAALHDLVDEMLFHGEWVEEEP